MSSPKETRRIKKRPGRAAHGSLHRHGSAIVVCGKVLNLDALKEQMAEDFRERYGIPDIEESDREEGMPWGDQ
jgi:hypothetical protein